MEVASNARTVVTQPLREYDFGGVLGSQCIKLGVVRRVTEWKLHTPTPTVPYLSESCRFKNYWPESKHAFEGLCVE